MSAYRAPVSSPSRARCAVHGLAVVGQEQCALCRTEARGRARQSRRRGVLVLFAALAAVGGALWRDHGGDHRVDMRRDAPLAKQETTMQPVAGAVTVENAGAHESAMQAVEDTPPVKDGLAASLARGAPPPSPSRAARDLQPPRHGDDPADFELPKRPWQQPAAAAVPPPSPNETAASRRSKRASD